MPLTSHFSLQDPRFQSVLFPMIIPTTISTAGAVTYTPAQLMTGWIMRDCNGGARTDTLPNAVDLVSAIQGCMVNTAFEFELRNISGTAVAVTLAAGTGGTLSPASTSVAQNNSRSYVVVITNITPGSYAYTLYSRATGAF